ncbi:hypothetical protein GY45DRAFT_593276 [Cubamyces sp. BRFM 1775]|nr:hypothetical protein GY45DRAFT_593276 [Cubamyces sp. BRFM 1775]
MMVRASSLCLLGFGLLGLFSGSPIQAKDVLIVVDDASPDPLTGQQIQYTPAEAWRAVKDGNCDDCVAHLNVSQAYQGTWHEGVSTTNATSPHGLPKASFSFVGTSVSVYCFVESSAPEADWDLSFSLLFSIDNEIVDNFTLTTDLSSKTPASFIADPFISKPLPMGNHTVEVMSEPLSQRASSSNQSQPVQNRTVIVLDYIEYIVDVDQLPTSITVPAGLPTIPSDSPLAPVGTNTTTNATQSSAPPARTSTTSGTGSVASSLGDISSLAVAVIVSSGLVISAL